MVEILKLAVRANSASGGTVRFALTDYGACVKEPNAMVLSGFHCFCSGLHFRRTKEFYQFSLCSILQSNRAL